MLHLVATATSVRWQGAQYLYPPTNSCWTRPHKYRSFVILEMYCKLSLWGFLSHIWTVPHILLSVGSWPCYTLAPQNQGQLDNTVQACINSPLKIWPWSEKKRTGREFWGSIVPVFNSCRLLHTESFIPMWYFYKTPLCREPLLHLVSEITQSDTLCSRSAAKHLFLIIAPPPLTIRSRSGAVFNSICHLCMKWHFESYL